MIEPHFAKLETDFWELENLILRQQQPEKITLPEPGKLKNIQPGQAVKMVFLLVLQQQGQDPKIIREKMWVLVTEVTAGYLRGYLDNQPKSTADMASGMEVFFLPENILEISFPPQEYFEQRIRTFGEK